MYKICKTRQSAERQRMIENEFLDMLQTQEYSQIKVSELCSRIGIPRKSFYVYFETKEDILHALIDHTLLGYYDFKILTSDTPNSVTYAELQQYFEYWKGNDRLLNGLQKSHLSGVLVLRAVGMVSDRENENPFLNWSRDMRPSEEAILYTMSGLITLVLDWHYKNFQKSSEEMAGIATDLLTKSLFEDSKG